MAERKIWSCKIGEVDPEKVPQGSDAPMRDAVAKRYRYLTGADPGFIFSGWGDDLDESERAVVEDRLPDPRVIMRDLQDRMDIVQLQVDDPPVVAVVRVDSLPTRDQIRTAIWDAWGSTPDDLLDRATDAVMALFGQTEGETP
jgi:hypothetical protein